MNATQQLDDLCQSLWLDNITRGLLTSGTLSRHTREFAVTDEGYAEAVLAEFIREGVNDEALAADLQREGAAAFSKSWSEQMYCIASKSELLAQANQS